VTLIVFTKFSIVCETENIQNCFIFFSKEKENRKQTNFILYDKSHDTIQNFVCFCFVSHNLLNETKQNVVKASEISDKISSVQKIVFFNQLPALYATKNSEETKL
jgi:hypothetical protein